MNQISRAITRVFSPAQPVPEELRSNFRHLYFDIGWYGILIGTTLAFLSVYATRIHATGQQIGFISAGPAIVNLIFTLPAGMLLNKFKVSKSIFWASIFNRFFYGVLIFLPLFVRDDVSVWLIIISTLIMNIPGSILSVGFTVFFGEAVPAEWRSMVAGVRNAVVGLVTVVFTLISGQVLKHFSLDVGYAIVFGMGFIGAAMSSYHLLKIKPVKYAPKDATQVELSAMVKPQNKLNFSILKGKFGIVVGLLLIFHFFQYLPIAIFPIFQINHLGLDEQNISIAATLFYMMQFIISLQLAPLVRRSNNLKVMGVGMVMYGIYPFLLPLCATPWVFYVVSAIGGLAMGLVGGVLLNYLLEKMSENDRPAHMVLYNISLNTAILAGSLLGPALAGWVGFVPALIISAIGRSLIGAAILRWG